MATVNKFQDLECWKAGREFRLIVSAFCKKFPDFEKYVLTSQLLRSSRSVCDNIAEGFGRYHYQENSQFCRQARGSLHEALNQCITALDEQYITEDDYKHANELFEKTNALLNGYINYLQRAKVEAKNK
jgi:four helix bundle protein